ncbi:hypothetical protein [Deinococcus sp. Marseille-Q6407]|uniref:hypothetical protein n=1 Tax=Deinococcus sp. Marseille-Q6407 TaxID=2969223 RepID=UPI0021C17A17|nr:hypothetical protein [Deinococcus sp. Marseille-Q6407]
MDYATSVPARPGFRPLLQAAGRVLRGVVAGLLGLLGLALAALCVGRFSALGAGAPLWLDTLAAAEQLAGQLLFGSAYAGWDGFARALILALLSSISLGTAAWAWPRRRMRVAAGNSPYLFSYQVEDGSGSVN